MTIALIYEEDHLKIKILPGLNWQTDLDRIKTISGRRWDADEKIWTIPVENIEEILTTWEQYEIISSNKETEDLFKLPTLGKPIYSLPPIVGPLDFTREPRPHQEKFIRLHKSLNRLLLAAGTGLGKTLMTLERYKVLGVTRLLLVVPKVIRYQWEAYVKEVFGYDSLVYWEKTAKQRQKLLLKLDEFQVVICTYETAGELIKYEGFKALLYDGVIIDEAHLLANKDSQRTKAIKLLVSKLHKDVKLTLLTGTPIQHKIKDLWSLVHLINPKLAGSYRMWCDRYEEVLKRITLKNRNGKILLDRNGNPRTIPFITRPRNTKELQERLSSIMFRVSSDEVKDFEDSQELIHVELTTAQRRLYETMREEILIDLGNKTLRIQDAPVRMLRLLQAAEGLFNFNQDNLESTKLEYLQYQIDNLEEEEKLVVWTRFKPLCKVLKDLYPEQVVNYFGEQSDSVKPLSIYAFNGVHNQTEADIWNHNIKYNKDFNFDPGKAKIFISTIDLRSALGFDLHKFCSRQIFTSFSFMGAANHQAAARLIRMGQSAKVVSTEYLVARNTLEPKALTMILNNFNKTLEVLDGKESLSYRQTEQMVGLLKIV